MESIVTATGRGRVAMTDSPDATDRRARHVELSIFLLLIVPAMALSFVPAAQDDLPFRLLAVSTILRDVALVALILFFLWRGGETPRAVGWSTAHAVREVGLGAILFVPVFYGAQRLEALLLELGLSGAPANSPNLAPSPDPADVLLALAMVVVVAISEETIFRGYLLHRLRPLVGSRGLALFLASAIFALGHGYEGVAGAVTVGAIGAAFGAVYLWRRTIVAPATMHFLLDLVAIVVLPLLG